MKESTINGQVFAIPSLPAYPDQLLLARAATPIMTDILPIIVRIVADPEMMAQIKARDVPTSVMMDIIQGITGSIQKLKDEDLLNLTRRALAKVQIKQGDAGWANVMAGEVMMFPLDLQTIFRLIWEVVELNLLGFMFAARGTSRDGKPRDM